MPHSGLVGFSLNSEALRPGKALEEAPLKGPGAGRRHQLILARLIQEELRPIAPELGRKLMNAVRGQGLFLGEGLGTFSANEEENIQSILDLNYRVQLLDLSQNRDPDSFAEDLLQTAGDQADRGRHQRASLLYSALIRAFPKSVVAARARGQLRVLGGQGSPVEHAMMVGQQLASQFTDMGLAGGILAGATAFRTVSGGVLRFLGSRTLISRGLAYASGSLFEIPVFTYAMKGIHQLTAHQDWSSEALRAELLHNGLTLLGLRSFGGLGYSLLNRIVRSSLPAFAVQTARLTLPFGSMFGGIHAVHGAAVALGWEHAMPAANAVIQSLATVGHFHILGKVLQPLLPTHGPVGLPTLEGGNFFPPWKGTPRTSPILTALDHIVARLPIKLTNRVSPEGWTFPGLLQMASKHPTRDTIRGRVDSASPQTEASRGGGNDLRRPAGEPAPVARQAEAVLESIQEVAREVKRTYTTPGDRPWPDTALRMTRELVVSLERRIEALRGSVANPSVRLRDLHMLRWEVERSNVLLTYLYRHFQDPAIRADQYSRAELAMMEVGPTMGKLIEKNPSNVPHRPTRFFASLLKAADSTTAYLTKTSASADLSMIEHWQKARAQLHAVLLKMRGTDDASITKFLRAKPSPDLHGTWLSEARHIQAAADVTYQAALTGASEFTQFQSAARNWRWLLEATRSDLHMNPLLGAQFGEGIESAALAAGKLNGLLVDVLSKADRNLTSRDLENASIRLYRAANAMINFLNELMAGKPADPMESSLPGVITETLNTSRVLRDEPVLSLSSPADLEAAIRQLPGAAQVNEPSGS